MLTVVKEEASDEASIVTALRRGSLEGSLGEGKLQHNRGNCLKEEQVDSGYRVRLTNSAACRGRAGWGSESEGERIPHQQSVDT